MRLLLLLSWLLLLSNIPSFGQIYPDHFGTGNSIGVAATSSPVQNGDSIQATINGTGYLVDNVAAYRFMAQAGFGATEEDIDNLLQLGIKDWLDWQIAMPYNTYTQVYDTIHNEALLLIDACNPTNDNGYSERERPAYLNMAFYHKVLREQDIFRQKAAFALSQIFVVAPKGGTIYLHYKGKGFANYYDVLYDGAFGNFRDLLTNITLSPTMADYLTYFSNRKEDPIAGTLPDENYSREIMQLFTIGLIELNNNGTPRFDNVGNTIPTYTNQDIKELAKVFTGLYGAEIDLTTPALLYNNFNYYFGRHNRAYNWELPMVMSQTHHDAGAKVLPDGDIIPANQAGMQDIDDAIEWLFKHPNVGPFIGYRLIQQLVKSNPTPEYVNRVASAFNDNGNGVRGDMGAVFRSILLDPEARDCEWIDHPNSGKLLQPIERYMNVFKALDINSVSGKLRFSDTDANFGEAKYILQGFLSAPSVFNFFSPFYTEGEIEESDLVAPEFQILNDVTGIHYVNRIEEVIKRISAGQDYQNLPNYTYGAFPNFTSTSINGMGYCYVTRNLSDRPYLDYSFGISLCGTGNLSALIDYLDLRLCRGQLDPDVKVHILQHLNDSANLAGNDCSTAYHSLVKDAVFLIMLSASYTILK